MKLYSNILKISLIALFTSCTQKDSFDSVQEPSVTVSTIDKESISKPDTELNQVIKGADLEANKNDTDSVASNADSSIVTFDSITQKSIEPVKRDPVQVKRSLRVSGKTVSKVTIKEFSYDNQMNVETVKSKDPCINEKPEGLFERNPYTKEEAQEWGYFLWGKAKYLQEKGSVDSSLYYANRGIAIYENGSLFTIKSLCMLIKKEYSSAKTIAEVSLGRTDHWGKERDRELSLDVRLKALEELSMQYPSALIKKQIEEAKSDCKDFNDSINF